MNTLYNVPATHNRERKPDTAQSTLDKIPAPLNRERLLDTAQSAEFLGFSVPHFRRLYKAQKVPAPVKIGERKYGWRLGGLIEFVAAKTGEAA
jgi:predicted DNA-binding transcriptional regulator AlpA